MKSIFQQFSSISMALYKVKVMMQDKRSDETEDLMFPKFRENLNKESSE